MASHTIATIALFRVAVRLLHSASYELNAWLPLRSSPHMPTDLVLQQRLVACVALSLAGDTVMVSINMAAFLSIRLDR